MTEENIAKRASKREIDALKRLILELSDVARLEAGKLGRFGGSSARAFVKLHSAIEVADEIASASDVSAEMAKRRDRLSVL